jgi:hypothetical protein
MAILHHGLPPTPLAWTIIAGVGGGSIVGPQVWPQCRLGDLPPPVWSERSHRSGGKGEEENVVQHIRSIDGCWRLS